MSIKPIELTPSQQQEVTEIKIGIREAGDLHDALASLIKQRDDARNERDDLQRQLDETESAAEDNRMD